MSKNTQLDRILLNVVIPFVNSYEERFAEISFEEMVQEMFLSISFEENDDRPESSLTFRISSDYSNIFKLHFTIIQSEGLKLNDIDGHLDEEVLYETHKENPDFEFGELYNFEQLENIGLCDLTIKEIKRWWLPRSKYIFDWKKDYLENKNTKKRKFKSIFSEL